MLPADLHTSKRNRRRKGQEREWGELIRTLSMMQKRHPCPCGSEGVSRDGRTRYGKQNYKCRDCGQQFVLDSQY